MAKKKEEIKEPIVSSIPIPPSESALIIDLPDGQKLLVGKIQTGTVIEVATWRGTGRPDSRTNRLMLGVSSESDGQTPTTNEVASTPALKNLPFPQKILYLLTKYSGKSLSLANRILKSLIVKIKEIDFKNLKLPSMKFPKESFRKTKNNVVEHSEAKQVLKIEDDFDVDFQRILNEVSQRRNVKKGNSNKPKKHSTESRSQKPKTQGAKRKK